MSVQSSDHGMTSAAFNALEVSRLTWMGLILATIGWALLLSGAIIPDILTSKIAWPLPVTFHADLLDIAKCVIASGFAIAIIGALQSGFGTLNRFFSAVLVRSAQRSTPVPQAAPIVETQSVVPEKERRPYRLLADGSVEVDTILGTRRFATMHEAREFI